MAKKKNKQMVWIIAIVAAIFIFSNGGLMSILGTSQGFESIEPVSLSDVEIDINDELVIDTPTKLITPGPVDWNNADALIYGETSDPFIISQFKSGVPTQDLSGRKVSLFGVVDLKISDFLNSRFEVTQSQIDRWNQEIENEYGFNPHFIVQDWNDLTSKKCEPVINLYKKFVPILLSEGFKIKVSEFVTISDAGLRRQPKGRDIYQLNIVLPSENLQLIGEVWCNKNNELINYQLDLNNNVASFENWYFDKYFIESTTGNGDDQWISGVPNWAIIIGGIALLMMMMLGRR